MEKQEYISASLEETDLLAKKLAEHLEVGSVITLEGNLGTGKTAFTKSLAKALEIEEPITSPTFTIIKEYEGTLPLYHMDTYRLEGSDEDIGFDEYINGDGITVIEWAQFIEDFLPEELLNIHIEYLDESSRNFILNPKGSYYENLVRQLLQDI